MSEANRIRFMQGNEAIFEGAVAAGANFYAGYPITPSSEIAELASKRLPALGGVYLQMEDEIGSIAAVIGAAAAGAKSFTATSGPGFSLMQENLGLAIMGEVPCVIINVQRSGPSTGLATKPAQGDVMQARWGTHGDHSIIVLTPSSVQECFELTVVAFNYAQQFRSPVILLADEIVGHMREDVVLESDKLHVVGRKAPTCGVDEYLPYAPDESGVPYLAEFGGDYILRINSSMHDERGYPDSRPSTARAVIKRLYDKIESRKSEICIFKEYFLEDAEAVLVSYGATARAAREAALLARNEGMKTGVLQLCTLWPFSEEIVRRACNGADVIFVPEMNLGQLVREVERAIGREKRVVGINKSNGEPLTPDEILAEIRSVMRG